MWYILEYKKSAKARTWQFQSASGDKALLDGIAAEYEAAGIIARVRPSDQPK